MLLWVVLVLGMWIVIRMVAIVVVGWVRVVRVIGVGMLLIGVGVVGTVRI